VSSSWGSGAPAARDWRGSRVLASQLCGISATDPTTFACLATMLAVAALAAVVPARRATRVDPVVVALRRDSSGGAVGMGPGW
jgi:hypothetical protein